MSINVEISNARIYTIVMDDLLFTTDYLMGTSSRVLSVTSRHRPFDIVAASRHHLFDTHADSCLTVGHNALVSAGAQTCITDSPDIVGRESLLKPKLSVDGARLTRRSSQIPRDTSPHPFPLSWKPRLRRKMPGSDVSLISCIVLG